MISETLAYWTIVAPGLMLILLYCVVLLPPIIYVIHAIKVRRRILGQVDTHGQARGTCFHFTSFARRPSGEFPFTHGQARGTLPFGLLEKLTQEVRLLREQRAATERANE